MEAFVEKINQILAEWDPIGVGENIATVEYRGYIPAILKSIDNKENITACLVDILVKKNGIGI